MSEVSINSTWKEVEWWQDDTNNANQKVRWRLIARCEEDVEDNSSDVYFWVQKRITNGDQGWAEYPTYKDMEVTCTGANSDTHRATMSWTFGRCESTTWSDADGDYHDAYWSNVKHNADGTLTVRAYITGDRITSSSDIDTWVDLVLPTIPRASKPTASKSTVTLNGTDSVVINTNRASSNFTHTLTITVGGNTTTVRNVGASHTWTPAVATWMPYMHSWKETVTVGCTTYSGSTQIGSVQTTSFSLQVDTSVYHPTIEQITATDTNSTTSALETAGSFIRKYSQVQIQAEASMSSSDYGYALANGSVTYGSATAGETISGQSATFTKQMGNAAGASAVVKVKDNKGYEVSQTKAISVVPYDDIQITKIALDRVNQNGQPSETGTYISYELEAKVFSGSFGQVTNEIKLYSLSADAGSSTVTTTLEDTITTTGNGSVETITLTGMLSGTYSSSAQFDIRIRLEDKLSTATSTAQRINEGVPVFAWGSDHFDVYGEFHIHDREDISKYLTLGVNSVETIPVTFSGASGGTVNWTVFKFGKFRIAVCKWKATTNAVIDGSWAGIYYSNDFNSPNYPLTFADVQYFNIRYVAADAASHAELWDGGRTSVSNQNAGAFYLTRPNDGGAVTVAHPVFVEIVIGTV